MRRVLCLSARDVDRAARPVVARKECEKVERSDREFRQFGVKECARGACSRATDALTGVQVRALTKSFDPVSPESSAVVVESQVPCTASPVLAIAGKTQTRFPVFAQAPKPALLQAPQETIGGYSRCVSAASLCREESPDLDRGLHVQRRGENASSPLLFSAGLHRRSSSRRTATTSTAASTAAAMPVTTATLLLLLEDGGRRDSDSASARERSVRHASHSHVGGVERQVVMMAETDTAHSAVLGEAASLRATSALADAERLAETLLLRVRLFLRRRGWLRRLACRDRLERSLRRNGPRRAAPLSDLDVAIPATQTRVVRQSFSIDPQQDAQGSHGTTSTAAARSRVEATRWQTLCRQDGRSSERSVTELGVPLTRSSIHLRWGCLRRRRTGTGRVLQVTQVEDGPMRNGRAAVVGAAVRLSLVSTYSHRDVRAC